MTRDFSIEEMFQALFDVQQHLFRAECEGLFECIESICAADGATIEAA